MGMALLKYPGPIVIRKKTPWELYGDENIQLYA